MEDCARTGLHDLNLASRKAEEAGQSFSIYFHVYVSVWVQRNVKMERKGQKTINKFHKKKKKVDKFVMFSVVSGFQ